jgi:CheY-like chemotaxis protein
MLTVLVVDDDEQARFALEMAILPISEVRVLSAADGAEALAALLGSEPPVDAVVTDLSLPRLDGFGLAESIRNHPEFGRIPIVVVTANHSPEVVRRLTILGVDAVFRKPFSNSELRLALEALLNARQETSHPGLSARNPDGSGG